jgi:hypothetical protein
MLKPVDMGKLLTRLIDIMWWMAEIPNMCLDEVAINFETEILTFILKRLYFYNYSVEIKL